MIDTTLSLVYTANVRGNLSLLPRLYTVMQTLQHPPQSQRLLLDLGQSCDADTWHCAATGGRSAAVVLDGMGFHAANVQGLLTAEARMKLKGVTTLAPVDDRSPWRYDVPPVRDEGVIVSTVPTPALRLCILLTPAESTRLTDRVLSLATVDTGEKYQIGRVTLDLSGEPTLLDHSIITLPTGTRPDATITAAVSFVEDEARYYQKQQK